MTAREEEVLRMLRNGIPKDRWGGLDVVASLDTMREAAALIEELRGGREKLREALKSARAQTAALVPDNAAPDDDTDQQIGFRNAIGQAVWFMDEALKASQ